MVPQNTSSYEDRNPLKGCHRGCPIFLFLKSVRFLYHLGDSSFQEFGRFIVAFVYTFYLGSLMDGFNVMIWSSPIIVQTKQMLIIDGPALSFGDEMF